MNVADKILLFHTVVKTGTFSQAASRIGMTNSVVSKHISQLEQHLGVKLLHRTTRKLRLTEAGHLLYQHAQDVDQSVENAIKAVSEVSTEPTGKLCLSVPVISGEYLIAGLVAEFCRSYPKLKIELRLEDHQVDLVAEGVDLAIRTASLPDSSLIAKLLVQSKWIVSASPEYLTANGTPQAPQDLINHNCLTYTYMETGSNDWIFHQGKSQDRKEKTNSEYSIKVAGNISSNNQIALKNAALAGDGVIYTPKLLVYNDLKSGRLQEILADVSGKQLPIYAVYPHSKYLPEKMRLLIDFIAAGYSKNALYFS
ncbi:MAG: LysR family transcriptional regulator [Colwellia sp.]|jgi:Transcriptional regulator